MFPTPPRGFALALTCLATVSGGVIAMTEEAAASEARDLIVIAALVEPATIDSASAYNANSRTILGNIFEGLVGRDGATNQFVPELATSWEQIDPKTWRFQLREGVSFHDGSPFNAAAASHALSWVWSEENSYPIRTLIGPEMRFEAVGEYALEVHTNEPDPLLLTRLWQSYVPSSEHIRQRPDQWGLEAVGTGPYRLVDWSRGNSLTLEVNASWWGHDSADATGQVSFNKARFDFRPEASGRIAALLAGEAQFAERLPGDLCRSSLDDLCVTAPDNSTTYIRLDAMNPVLGDARVRRALSLSIDREAIGELLMGGAASAAMIVGPSATGFNPNLKPHPYDPEGARALIEESKAAGVPLESTPLRLVTLSGGFLGNSEVMEALLESFKGVGVTTATAEILERGPAWTNVFINPPRPIDPERGLVALHKHTNDAFDFASTISVFYLCELNNSTSCNPRVDELHKSAVSLVGAERQKAYEEIAAVAYEDNYIIPLHYELRFHGVSSDLNWSPRLDAVVRLIDIAPK